MRHFRVLNGLCGSRKTQHIIGDAIRRAKRGGSSVIAVPSIDLAEEIRERAGHPGFHAIHSRNAMIGDDGLPSLIRTIVDHIKNPDNWSSDILIITQAALDLVAWDRWQEWQASRHLYIDEIPAIDAFIEKRLPRTHEDITSKIQIEPYSLNEVYSLIS